MPWQPQTAATTASYGGNLPVLYCPDADQNGYCVNGDGWPNGHTGKDAHPADHRHVQLPQRPARIAPRVVAVVGLADGPQAGLVRERQLLRRRGHDDLRRRQPAIWWLAIFAMGFICWQAFKRRSLGLTLIAVAFFWQWLSWSRIDRAAFQYHFYTALPFFLAALAYFMAELWHGPSRRTWLLARFAAAAALIFPAALWLFKDPLCNLARVSASNNGFKDAICGSGTGDVRIEERVLLIGIVLVVALVAPGAHPVAARAPSERGSGGLVLDRPARGARRYRRRAAVVAGPERPDRPRLRGGPPSDGIVLLLLPVLAILAFIVFTARNPRRFVLGACASSS